MKEQEKTPFNLRETVTVYATEKNPVVATGTEMKMGKLSAEYALKQGLVTDKAPKETKSKAE